MSRGKRGRTPTWRPVTVPEAAPQEQPRRAKRSRPDRPGEPEARDSRIRQAARRARYAKHTLVLASALAFAAALMLARGSYAGHAKHSLRPLSAPPRFVAIVRTNRLQAGVVAPAEAPPGAETSVS